MSFGSTGAKFTSSVNQAVNIADAFQDTGEGGITPYHAHSGDVVLQIGTGYFGCGYTNEFGERIFSLKLLEDIIKKYPNIRAISIKLSQGAKAGHGGVLPGKKVTKEIADIRGVEIGKTVFSPPHHSAFSNVDELVTFVEKIASSTGLPVGIKSAVSDSRFWKELAGTMYRRYPEGPDFIQVDGGEGGTGSAPPSFADNISLPFFDAFPIVYKTFKEFNLTDRVFFIGSGRLGLPTKAVMAFSMGVNAISIAREAMMSAGCIQAMRCHTGNCPAGIATHSWWLQRGYDEKDKSVRIARFIKTLRRDILHLCYAAGHDHPSKFNTESVMVRHPEKGFVTLKEIVGYEK
jgi:glutamate synthase domain-containing protein 2